MPVSNTLFVRIHTLAAIGILATTLTCGGDGDDDGDCRDADLECHEPFACLKCEDATECRDEEDVGVEWKCMSPRDSRPTCKNQPDGQTVPFETADSGTTVHWPQPATCIATSYHSNIADRLDAIRAALKAWQDVSCSQICFEDPIQLDEEPDTSIHERRIHFVTEAPLGFSPGESRNSETTINFEEFPDTGWIVRAIVRIRPTDDPTV